MDVLDSNCSSVTNVRRRPSRISVNWLRGCGVIVNALGARQRAMRIRNCRRAKSASEPSGYR